MSSWTFTPYNFPLLLPQASLCLFMAVIWPRIKMLRYLRKLLIQFCRKVSKKKSEALSDHGVTNILCWSIVSNQNEKKLSHGAPARTLGGGSGVSMGSSLDKRQTTFWTKHSRGLGIISLDIQEAGHQIFHFNRSLSLDHIRSSII